MVRIKIHFDPVHATEKKRDLDIQLRTSYSSVVDGVKWSASGFICFTGGNRALVGKEWGRIPQSI
jgi:hypothetical protein